MTDTPLIQTRGLTRAYPGVIALDHVDFDVARGEVHVLFGENGAGKSTLISLLAGANIPSEGTIEVEGRAVRFASVADAQAAGIYTVFQEFSLIPTMTVAQNMFLGREPGIGPFTDHRAMRRGAQELLDRLGFDVPVGETVAHLSRAQQQIVEIAKAFHGQPKCLILDEPTASLTDREVDHLFETILKLRDEGVAVIYISHRIHEFERIADRVTVLRDGAYIGTVPMAETDEATLVEMMAGRAIRDIYPDIPHDPAETLLEVENLRAWGVNGASLTARRGEVLGMAGLVGSGKSRLFRALMGIQPIRSGTVRWKGEDITGAATRHMIGAGLYYLSSDRKAEGLDLAKSAWQNLGIDLMMGREASAMIRPRALRDSSAQIFETVELKDSYRPKAVAQLSGGNQQKVLFAKSFGHDADLFIFDEPTVGVDMGTRAALYRLTGDIAASGKAVIVISSDLPEVLNLAHRVLVMAGGRITAELTGDARTEDNVLRNFFDDTGETA
ncbi:monosaccharide ABC transporter ATP-binding protein, CUT2 family [Roseovarius nanhaiticus]|uniref:Monosaccharide ABC transporter ATP-binding protein, CUT2 family n=1 Tax=Roseovarius nanhaiticus TaxID=573024 RepID=A0A1N7H0D8_9RHOB|nr:sugar ABC transporter ATP-binding protein [Roseovarius nanhaiticus]SEL17498.1 monosaccharide ABC transporter ATP-binding protein, CUT2 family [Roseovarius nanhaiticus]SIS18303.1 monosaccharide ABC transporter ATP-binding protein, CUT2 family [Roseovarius nanhaiticus]